jgi:hypothetical protein
MTWGEGIRTSTRTPRPEKAKVATRKGIPRTSRLTPAVRGRRSLMLHPLDLVGFTTMVVAIRVRIASTLTRSYQRRKLLSFKSLGHAAVLLLLPILKREVREVRKVARGGVHRIPIAKKAIRRREKQRDKQRRQYAWTSLR